ncbi:alpha/beta hydrolase [Chryseobacterium antibioticum]|uniref:Alpha/beta hydrolase n=1 Tax=Chryseobacterium pyrolae TaxID=2987481 RepID=A0ABT2IM79_9FLAO|nr:alpha/beta hydrolase [Chryseobacterium pyrolae]MCT2409728.1 alpha/beta hydrolase [Chryseobacterium pyrolae]
MRTLITLIIVLFMASQYEAQTQEKKFQISSSLEQIPLWTHTIPDGPGPQGAERITAKGSATNISKPRLIVHQPSHPNGTAILVISGGGYAHIELGKESTPAANWFQSEGVTAFELIYRLPSENWKNNNVPFEDAQRAMRLIRSLANKYNIDVNKIGILGFSAGGHLAGFTAAQHNKKFYKPVDEIDSLSARPDFAGLIYPVISMLPPNDNTHSRKSILGEYPSLSEEAAFSVEKQVNSSMPVTFLAQAMDDPISPVDNSELLYSALKQVNVRAEMHLFQTDGHGWGLGKKGTPTATWPELFKTWVTNNGFWK